MYTSKHCKLVRKNNFDALLLTESVCSSMNVRSPKPWDTKLSTMTCFLFVLDFFISLMCVWLKKTTVLFICIHKRVKLFCFFCRVHKICDESGLAILKYPHHILCRMFLFLSLIKHWYVASATTIQTGFLNELGDNEHIPLAPRVVIWTYYCLCISALQWIKRLPSLRLFRRTFD